ncbi:MAG: tRNA epoxyqueuosine(34) reductase QueG [Balneolaceae bacterium]
MIDEKLRSAIRNRALSLGFDACGFAKAEKLDQEATRLENWLNRNRHGEMTWMERHFDKRIDPTRLHPGTRTVLSVIGSYNHPTHTTADNQTPTGKIAKYARGRDYHKVFKQRLRTLYEWIEENVGSIEGRIFTDSAPVMDKVWAERAGLGWLGKNGNLMNRTQGSWFLIGEILLDLEIEPDGPVTDHCGSCTRCLDACPTDAIIEPYVVDATACISYLTIELKDRIPDRFQEKMDGWIFGCDICQDVCPWNRKAAFGRIEDFHPRENMLHHSADFWQTLSKSEYEELFNGTPVRRASYDKLQGTIEQVLPGSARPDTD